MRDAFRHLMRAPRYVVMVALSLGIAIGGNVAIFTAIDAVLVRPLPYPNADRLVLIDGVFARLPLLTTDTGIELAEPVAAPELGTARAFTNIGSFVVTGLNVGNERPVRLQAAAVTPGFFAALGARPTIGRVFTEDDVRRASRVAVISERLWRQRFDRDRAVLDRTIDVNGNAFAITAVMPAGIDFPDAADIWIPYAADRQIATQVAVPRFVGRLAPGATRVSARQEILRLIQANPLTRQEPLVATLRVTRLHDALVEAVRPTFIFLSVAALLVLLVACSNSGNLMLARMTARQQEFAVRRAIGASAWQIARQIFCESLILTCLAGAVAIPGAFITLNSARAFIPSTLHGTQTMAVDVRSIVGLVALALVSAGLVGLTPAISAATREAALTRTASATSDDQRWRRWRSALVTFQIAMAVAILACASTIVRHVRGLTATDLGARNPAAVVMEVMLPRATYRSPERIRAFYDRLQHDLRSVALVQAIGATNHLPGSQTTITPSMPMVLDGQQRPASRDGGHHALRLAATPEYFRALGIDVLAGRGFSDSDQPHTPAVALVSEAFVRAFRLQPRDIIGRHVMLGTPAKDIAEIVGVVRDVRMRGPESDVAPALYLPFAQIRVNATGFIVVKSNASANEVVPVVRSVVARIDPSLPLYNVQTFDQVQAAYLVTRRFAMTTILAFGVIVFVLAGFGLYAVANYMVRLRTRELGIRIAIGAAPALLRRQVIVSGVLQAFAGIALGIVVAVTTFKLVAASLPGFARLDPAALGLASALVLFVSISAVWFPARRAARIDPLLALRVE